MSAVSLRVIVGLCICSVTCGLPLPRLVYQQEASPSAYWEIRPAPAQFDAYDHAFYNTYIQGRFDPDRPYIQMIVPGTDEVAEAEKKPSGINPFVGPTREPPAVDRDEKESEDKLNEACKNASLVLNGTQNGTNITDCRNETRRMPTPVHLMLADGTTLYSVGKEQGKKSNLQLSGAYELAYVAHRPSVVYSAPPQLYPVVQYADYNQIPWRGLGLIGNPYPGARIYEPLYIYRPVYPSISRSYDVYYYLPIADQQNAEHQEETEVVQDKNNEAIDEDIKPTGESEVKAEEQEADEIVTPNALEELDPQEQALVDALNSKSESVQENKSPPPVKLQGEENTGVTEEDEVEELDALQNIMHFEEKLDKISDEDLISAVETVLQQLHSRLMD